MSVKRLSGSVLVDTNVLIYATLEADPRHAQAREVLSLRLSPTIQLCVSVQNLAEMYPNLTSPQNSLTDSPEIARRKIESIAGLEGMTVWPLSLSITRRALSLCQDFNISRQRYFDMQLTATMLEEGIGTVLTENSKDFEGIDEIRVVNPFLN